MTSKYTLVAILFVIGAFYFVFSQDSTYLKNTADEIAGLIGNKHVQAESSISVNFGSEYVFNPANTKFISITGLSADKLVIAYKDVGGSGYGRAVVGSLAGNSITFGSEYEFNVAATNYVSVTALNSDKLVVVYKDVGNSNYGTAVVGAVSDKTIAFGPEYVFNTAKTSYLSVISLDSNKFIVVYQDIGNSNYGTAVVGTISGNAISFSSEYIFNTTKTEYISVAALTSNKLLVAYKDVGANNNGRVVVGNLSNNSLSFGSEYVFNPANTEFISITGLSADKFVVAYKDVGGSGYGRTIIGQLTDNNIVFGSEYEFNTANTKYISSISLSDSRFIVSYQDSGNANYGTIVVGDVTNKTISYGSENVFNPSGTSSTTATFLTSNKFAVTYNDTRASKVGMAIIGTISAVCGNNILEEGETCDDGNNLNGDGCSLICQIELVCGNDKLEGSEECDDGNRQDNDGCSAICQIEEVEEPEPEPEVGIVDGDLIKNPSAEGMAQFDIYIVKLVADKKFKRLILSPHVFASYGHLKWDNIKDVNQATMEQYATSDLVRAENDEKVYQLFPQGDTGTKRWLNMTVQAFDSKGYDSEAIYLINQTDRDAYQNSDPIYN